MKKLVLVLTVIAAFGFFSQNVWADPGPYDATMNADGYDDDLVPDGVKTPKNTSSSEGQQIFQAINHVLTPYGLSPGLTLNGQTDSYQVNTAHSYWFDLGGPGQGGNFAVVGISAGHTNTLGVYLQGDHLGTETYFPALAQTGNKWLGTGEIAKPYPGIINPYSNGNFGFALKSNYVENKVPKEDKWYSDPLLNKDDIDHMLAFHLPELKGKTVYVKIGANTVPVVFSANSYLLGWEDLHKNKADFDFNDTIFLVTKVAPIPEPMSMLLLGGGLLGLVGLRRKVS